MSSARERTLAVGLALSVSLLTLAPYLAARLLAPPGWVSSGFLVNPYDGFSYLAKMHQGLEGGWKFFLPYAAAPGEGSLLFLFYLALGHLARLTSLPLLTTFHAARLLSGTCMFAAIYVLLEHLAIEPRARWSGYVLALGISGLGWLALSIGLVASDLLVPESLPVLSLLVNPHFPLATAGLAIGLTAPLTRGSTRKAAGIGFVMGFALGIVQPFVLATLWAVLGAWIGVEWARPARRAHWPGEGQQKALATLGACLLGGLPWVLYDLSLVAVHPALSQWSEQNRTPSPPMLSYLVGFAPLLAWSIVALVRARPLQESSLRLITTWAVLGFVLVYLPFGLQRRLSLGLAVPLLALAGLGIDSLPASPARKRLAIAGTMLVTTPSLLIVLASGLTASATPGSPVVLSQAETESYAWMQAHLPADSLVLAAVVTGNRIPAWVDARVIAGHPFETPEAEREQAWIARAFTWEDDPQAGLAILSERGIDFVYYGRAEQALGSPSWLGLLTPVYESPSIRLFAVPR